MKQFLTVLKFEFNNYLKNKTYVITTAFLCIAILGALFFPRITDTFSKKSGGGDGGSSQGSGSETKSVVAIINESGVQDDIMQQSIQAAFPKNDVKVVSENENTVNTKIENEEYEWAVILKGPLEYKYIVKTLSMYDSNTAVLDKVLVSTYQAQAMGKSGLSAAQVQDILGATTKGDSVALSKDQSGNFFFTYILSMLLYMAIIMYGQFVATSVATEKSSRAMEILITSANPLNLIYGKVLGSGLAGLAQMVLILLSGVVGYNANLVYWENNMFMKIITSMPIEIFAYTVIFFILGFFIYAFLFAAAASTVSRMEELNASIQPITYIFIIVFLVVMFSMSGGAVDTTLMKVASFFPLSSPMAMFVRVCMGNVATWEVLVSIAILVVSTGLIAKMAASIYKIGVLLYGTRPKYKDIVKMLGQK